MKYKNKKKMMAEFAKKNSHLIYSLFDTIVDATTYLPAQDNISAQNALERLRREEKEVREMIQAFIKEHGVLGEAQI